MDGGEMTHSIHSQVNEGLRMQSAYERLTAKSKRQIEEAVMSVRAGHPFEMKDAASKRWWRKWMVKGKK